VFAHVELKKQSELQRRYTAFAYMAVSVTMLIAGVLRGFRGGAPVEKSAENMQRNLKNVQMKIAIAEELVNARAKLSALK
jgi:hypothetical protein